MNSHIKDHALEPYPDDEALNIEDQLWWLQGRKAIIRGYVESARSILAIKKIVDVGCGSGGNFDVLSEYGGVIGIELSPTLARRAHARDIASAVIQGNAVDVISGMKDFQLVTLFDVLEHIEGDAEFLKQLNTSTPEQHCLLISVPACPFLYGEHDRILHHHRRYSRTMLQECLRYGGYHIVDMNYFMFLLFPLVLLERLMDKILTLTGRQRDKVNLGILPPALNQLFMRVLQLEARAGKVLRFPIGLWLFALAKKQS